MSYDKKELERILSEKPDAAIRFLSELNTAIKNPETPSVGDFIALDWDGNHPSDFSKGDLCISWYCSKVVKVEPDNGYRVDFDNGERVYKFKEFGWPKKSTHGDWLIYPALKEINS